VLYTEITCAKTSKLARMLKLDPGLKQEVLHVRLPEGGEAKLILQ